MRLGVIYGTGSIGKPCQFCFAKLVTNAQWLLFLGCCTGAHFLGGCTKAEGAAMCTSVCFCFAKTDAFRRLNSIYRLGYCEKKNILFVASRSDTYKVSMQQTVCSAILRGSGAHKLNLQNGLYLVHRFKFPLLRKLESLCTFRARQHVYKSALFCLIS